MVYCKNSLYNEFVFITRGYRINKPIRQCNLHDAFPGSVILCYICTFMNHAHQFFGIRLRWWHQFLQICLTKFGQNHLIRSPFGNVIHLVRIAMTVTNHLFFCGVLDITGINFVYIPVRVVFEIAYMFLFVSVNIFWQSHVRTLIL